MFNKPKILIDGNNNLYRALFSQPDIYNSKQDYTGASFGLLRILHSIKDMGDIIVCWDGLNSSKYRRQFYPNYKINRIKKEEEMTEEDKLFKYKKNISINQSQKLLTALGIPQIIINEIEADDIIAILSKHFISNNNEVIIVSNDRDLQQLLHLGLKVYSPIIMEIIDENVFKEKHGYNSNYLVLEKAICGDSSDNIKGLYKVGIKTFQKIAAEIESPTIDNILNWAKNGKLNKQKQTILENKELLELNCKIIDLTKSELPFEKILNKSMLMIKSTKKDIKEIIELFKLYEFKILNEMIYYNYFSKI